MENRQARVIVVKKLRRRFTYFTIFIGACLFLLGAVYFVIAYRTTDEFARSFYSNISAGFMGACFTFVILGIYEKIRLEIDAVTRTSLVQSQAFSLQNIAETQMKAHSDSEKQIERLSRHLNIESPELSAEILVSQMQLTKHSIACIENAIALLEQADPLMKSLLDQQIIAGDDEQIASVSRIYGNMLKDRKGMESSLQEVRDRHVVEKETLARFTKQIASQ